MKTKAITEGALLCALTVLLSLLCYYVPLMIILYIFIPVPMVVLAKRQDMRTTVVSSLAASAILFFFIDMMSGLTFAFYLIIVGCGLGYCYKKQQSGFMKMATAYMGIFITLIAFLIVFQMLSGVSFIATLSKDFTTISEQVLQTYQSTGIFSADQMTTLTNSVGQIVTELKLMIPSAFLMAPFFVGWAICIGCDTILKKIKSQNVPLQPVSQWQAPRSLKNILLVLALFLLIVQFAGIEAVPQIYVVTLIEITTLIYGVMGLSFVFWMINRKKDHEVMGWKILIVIVVLIIPMATTILAMIGILDGYTSLRAAIVMKDGEKK
ncbi:MAG: DUF2232 domain-containing protein [Eubacteriaceae bacterium]|jgi:uncharacterized protein YybS (DUF2232 family)|nr:DUF2232 domain-containing protein [Eubacteriaceae bacterium]MDD4507479.1 DUF2232 domain-containing protein [Eubacteriaceae bacterium]